MAKAKLCSCVAKQGLEEASMQDNGARGESVAARPAPRLGGQVDMPFIALAGLANHKFPRG
jgi:hypothetical protein